jgi:hypothetical protein
MSVRSNNRENVMKRMSLALVLAAAVGSYGTQGFAQTASTQQATASHISNAHGHAHGHMHGRTSKAHAVKTRVAVGQKSAKTVRAHKAVLPGKGWTPRGTADGIYSFTG